ncbi:MAG: phytanoyl-CoA dioxygenase family protein [Pseudomonadota bacterium]
MQTTHSPSPSPAFRIVDFLRTAELTAMGDAIHETVDGVARALRTPYADSAPDQDLFHRLQTVALANPVYASALLTAVYADAHLDPRITALQDNPMLLAAIAQVSGPFEPTGMTIRVRVNVPAMPQTLHGWHSDVAIPRPVRADSTCHTLLGACWIPLCDTDADNGGLELVTAHLDAPLEHTRSETGRFVIPDALLEGLPRQTPAVRAGEAAVIGRYTPHRSLPTTGARVRWSVVAWVKGQLR